MTDYPDSLDVRPLTRWPGTLTPSAGAVATLTDVHYGDDCGRTRERQQVVDAAGLPEPALSLCSQWAEPDAWHLVLSDVQQLTEPVPACGHQGLWTVPTDVERQLPCT